MTSPPDLTRKVRQLDNDVQSIYELLAAISGVQTRHGNRLDELDVRFDQVNARLDAMETRFDARFDAMDVRFDAMDVRFDAMDARFDEVLAAIRDGRGAPGG